MPKVSAGILLWRRQPEIQVLLAHPGGPIWANKDEGAWTIPKGLIEEGEDTLAGAVREFEEETGIRLSGPFVPLGSVTLKSKKIVHAWACEGDADPARVTSNHVEVKWQGQRITVPEVDRCEWFERETAMRKINPAQAEFVVRLAERVTIETASEPSEHER